MLDIIPHLEERNDRRKKGVGTSLILIKVNTGIEMGTIRKGRIEAGIRKIVILMMGMKKLMNIRQYGRNLKLK
jgi:hypothetical protein